MIDPTLLATGGIVAAVAGFWQQLKSFASYVSSFVILNTHLEYNSTTIIIRYLKSHFKVVPSGKLFFNTRYYTHTIKGSTITVPFTQLPLNTIFYRQGVWLLANYNASNYTLNIMALRGTVDFKLLLKEALEYDRHREDAENEGFSNFSVIDIIGQEKGFGSQKGEGDKVRGGNSTTVSQPIHNNSDSDKCIPLNYDIDESFLYARSEYMGEEKINSFKDLYYDPEVDKYIEQAKKWLSMKTWYQERHIPWRRGWLLHGPGGTGKSSLAKAVAQQLKIPLYHVQLATLSDQELISEWSRFDTPCVVLFEDFDTVFNKRIPLTEHKLLTFDTVLNLISGVGVCNGIFLIVTTNHLNYIDNALGVECDLGDSMKGISTRPGRIDSVIHLGIMSKENKYHLANKILKDWPDLIVPLVEGSGDITPVQMQELCVQTALRKMTEQTKPEVHEPRKLPKLDFKHLADQEELTYD